MKKVLVTGAGGFAGGYIAGFLYRQGYEVTGLVHHLRGSYTFPVVACDLAKPFELDGDFDIIVHAAGKTPQRKGIKREYEHQDFIEFKKNNIDSMENVVAFAHRKGIKKIIYLSTIGVYGEMRSSLITEQSDRVNPDVYGMTKYMAECILQDAADIESISLRMPGIIGLGSQDVWFTNMIEQFRKNEEVKIYSPAFQTKNFVWLDDLAKFVAKLIGMKHWQYDVVNLACQQGATVRDIVTEMKKVTHSSAKIVVGDGSQPFCLDAKRALGMGYESLSPLEIVEEFVDLSVNKCNMDHKI